MATHRPIATALLSYGMSGEVFHAPLLTAHRGFSLVKILERTKDKARQRYPEVKVVRSLEAILADDAIELVVVNTPHNTHADLTAQVLDAGKHVIVEKPFTNNVGEGERLVALAQSRNLMLSIFQNRRWDGDFMTVQQVIKAGVLGSVVELEAHYDRYRPTVDYATWKEKNEPGSGILYNLGAHMIDQALVLFGMPRRLTAHVGIQRPGGEAEDFYDIRMEYDHCSVILKSSYVVREPGPRYQVHGMNGSFVKHGLDPQEEALKEGKTPGGPQWGADQSNIWGKLNTTLAGGLHVDGKIETVHGNYLGFYDNIYEHLREGKPLAVTAGQALQVIRIIELAQKSSREQKTISIIP